MKTIYKYSLGTADFQTVFMPPGAEILCIRTQHGIPQLWALVDSDTLATEQRRIRIFGTGNAINVSSSNSIKYIGTFQLLDLALVFHAFEEF